jgi:hypothetical protein
VLDDHSLRTKREDRRDGDVHEARPAGVPSP